MPLNLELKLMLKSHAKVKSILKKMNIRPKGVLNQKDIYYRIKDGLLKLRIENKQDAHLIFYNRDEKSKKRWSNYFLLNVDASQAESFMERFMEKSAVVEKKRELYIYDNTRIHLDTVKNLGKFLELETVVLKHKSDAEKRFASVLKMLGLDRKTEIKASYKNLIESE